MRAEAVVQELCFILFLCSRCCPVRVDAGEGCPTSLRLQDGLLRERQGLKVLQVRVSRVDVQLGAGAAGRRSSDVGVGQRLVSTSPACEHKVSARRGWGL